MVDKGYFLIFSEWEADGLKKEKLVNKDRNGESPQRCFGSCYNSKYLACSDAGRSLSEKKNHVQNYNRNC